MKAFFKTLGAGIIYTIASPIYLALLALAMIFVFLKVVIASGFILINFINGKNYFADHKALLLAKKKKESGGVPPPQFNQMPPSNQPLPNQAPYQMPYYNYNNNNGGNNNG